MARCMRTGWRLVMCLWFSTVPALAQVTERVNVGPKWIQAKGASYRLSLSGDGRRFALDSWATNLVSPDANGAIADVLTGALGVPASLQVASVSSNGEQANGPSDFPDLSHDGSVVCFRSYATNLVPGAADQQIYVRDLSTLQTSLVSVDSQGVPGNSSSLVGFISADAMAVVFDGDSTNLVPSDTNGKSDVFLHDRSSAQTTRVSVSSTGAQGNGDSFLPSINADGRITSFISHATNLVAGDTNGKSDIFVHDRQTATTTRVSVASSGLQGDGACSLAHIDHSGRYVAFASASTNLVPGDTNNHWDVFLRDRILGTTALVSQGLGGAPADNFSGEPRLSGDGRFVVFVSYASNLVSGDANGALDYFLLDRSNGELEILSVNSQGQQSHPSGSLTQYFSLSGDGRFIGFTSPAPDLVPGDTNAMLDAFVRDRQGCPPVRTFFEDSDGDGFGRPDSSVQGCSPPLGWVLSNTDCDDSSAAVFPGAVELCNDVDDDCDGVVDDDFIIPYCTAKVNSQGCTPGIGYSGNPAWSGADDFLIQASSLLNNQPGIVIWSLSPAANPYGGGTLCLQQPIVRTPGQQSGGTPPPAIDCSGTYSFHFSQLYMAQNLLAANVTVYAQYWSRDMGFTAPQNMGLTDALQFTICP